MMPFASLFLPCLPSGRSAAGSVLRADAVVHGLSGMWVSGAGGLALHRVEDGFIGLSCLAIAATLGSFLVTAGRTLPFRLALIALTGCTAAAGLFCLAAAAVAGPLDAALTGQAQLFGVVLAVLTAGLLPFLLPLLLSKSRELRVTSLVARQNEKRFLAATQSSSDAFLLLDTLRAPNGSVEDFVFAYANGNAEKLIQLPGSRIVGARLTRILPLDTTDRLFQQFCEVLETGTPLIHEFSLDPDDPASPWMRHHVARLGDEGEYGLAITASDITERKHAELDLLQDAARPPARLVEMDGQHDPLTGLPNQRLLDDRMQQALARADRYRNRVAILLVDIDGLNAVNERQGRGMGDHVVRETALRLRSAIRATDSVIRMPDDQFVVLMPDMKLEIDVRRAAATLVAMLREPMTLDGRTATQASRTGKHSSHTVRITCSMGVAAYPDTALTVPELLAATTVALERAKQQGKNQYVLHTAFAEPGMDLDDRLAAEDDLGAGVRFEGPGFAQGLGGLDSFDTRHRFDDEDDPEFRQYAD